MTKVRSHPLVALFALVCMATVQALAALAALMPAARYHGRGGRLYMSTTGTGNAVPVTGLTNWTLNMPTDRVDVTAQGDTNKQWLQGLPDRAGDFAGFWENNEDILFAANESADGVKMYLYPNTSVPGKYFYGPAWVDASLTSPVGGAVAVSGSFAANGAWGRV